MRLERFLDTGCKFLPDRLSLIDGFDGLSPAERRLVSQIQGRTYARMFGRLLADQAPFRQLDAMMADCMPGGYRFVPEPDVVAAVVRSRSAWSVLALTCLIELLMRSHGRQSSGADAQIDPLWNDALRSQWRKASGHARLDELAWKREDERLDPSARDRAVGDLIVLVGMIDGILQAQARADAKYFAAASGRRVDANEQSRIDAALLNSYRWQYILSGVQMPHFSALLTGMLDAEQHGRVAAALAPLSDRTSALHVRWVA